MDRAGGFNSGWSRDTALSNLPILVVGPAKPSVQYILGFCPCWKADRPPTSSAGIKYRIFTNLIRTQFLAIS